ncbi:HMG box protein [Phlyctema vagabunda]|uniref:HMG box protein n=1 Tax=Phlyctema vagabunda TaxID=108571 RepID=A0ABR4PPD1_9HELO
MATTTTNTTTKKGKKVDAAPAQGATLSVDLDSFVRTRDSLVTGLATLQDAIQTLSAAYIKHTNAVLGQHGAGLDNIESAMSKLGENLLLGGIAGLNRASPARTDVPEEKKERKKRQHDINAPKRPLTPFFLYMQTARPIIAGDLGADVPKGAVSNEGTRRWKEMAEADKQLWSNAYKENLRLYNARIHSYKAGNVQAKDMSDEVALAYAEQHNIDAGPADASAQLLAEVPVAIADEDAEGEEDPEPLPVPPKTPKGKSRKAKGAAKEPEPASVAKPAPESVIQPPPSAAKAPTPDRKRKRTSTAKGLPVESIEKEDSIVETPKTEPKAKKSRAKKGKADA